VVSGRVKGKDSICHGSSSKEGKSQSSSVNTIKHKVKAKGQSEDNVVVSERE
jgi:hypothetical protein